MRIASLYFLSSLGSCEKALTVLMFPMASVANAFASAKDAQICLLIFLYGKSMKEGGEERK